MPDSDSSDLSYRMASTKDDKHKDMAKGDNQAQKDVKSVPKPLPMRNKKLRGLANGDNLAEKIKSAGYDVSQPTEEEGMLCYPQEEALPQSAKLETCPPDPRFQQQNVTKWCYRMYIDYKRCAHLLGNGSEYCDYFYQCYNSLCPNDWHKKWDEQIENGTFPRNVLIDMQPPVPKECEPDRHISLSTRPPKEDVTVEGKVENVAKRDNECEPQPGRPKPQR